MTGGVRGGRTLINKIKQKGFKMTLQDLIGSGVKVEKLELDRAKFSKEAMELYDWFLWRKDAYFLNRSFNEFVSIVLNTIFGEIVSAPFEDWGVLVLKSNVATSAEVILAVNCQILVDAASIDEIKLAFINSRIVV